MIELDLITVTFMATTIALSIAFVIRDVTVSEYERLIDDIEMWAKAACNACKEFTPNKQSKISCRYCQPTQILNIINRTKKEANFYDIL